MWGCYSGEQGDAVAMVTTVKSLQEGLRKSKRSLYYSPVLYADENTPRPTMDYHSQFFYKDKETYEFEKEFRILTPAELEEAPIDTTKLEDRRRLVDFDFNTGVERLVFHPSASTIFRDKVNSEFPSLFGSVQAVEDSIY